MTRWLWPHWAALRRRIASAHALLLLLDYDGTLVSVAAHPADAKLPRRVKRMLAHLAHQSRIRVVLISGRALRDLRRMVDVPGVCYVGNHGLEFGASRVQYVNPVAYANRALLQRFADDLQERLQAVPGAWVEDKGLTLSLHWREVPKSAQRTFHRLVADGTIPYLRRHRIRVTSGKRVIEIRPPVRWGKVEMVTWLRRRLDVSASAKRPLLLYVGDDATDEGAFRAVNRHGGISVFVGAPPRTTAAHWRVRSPRDVSKMLADILQQR